MVKFIPEMTGYLITIWYKNKRVNAVKLRLLSTVNINFNLLFYYNQFSLHDLV